MRPNPILSPLLALALVAGFACEPSPSRPRAPRHAAPAPSTGSATVDQTCRYLDSAGNCDVETMWPACQEAKLPDSGSQGTHTTHCALEFKPIATATAEDLRYPLCEVICRNSHKEDTRRCDDPARCVGLPTCTGPDDPGPCCDAVVDQQAIDRQYLEFAWRLFISMNIPREGQKQPEWLSWSAPFGLTTEPNSAAPVGAAATSPQANPCPAKSTLDKFLTVAWRQAAKVRGFPPSGHPIWYRSPAGLDQVQFQVLTNPESYNTHQSLVTDACTQALRAASRHKLELINSWWQHDHDDITGPVHVKAAWIRVPESDCGTEFICGAREGDLMQGLVALHVIAKTNHSERFWTWATFEHVRAVNADGALPALFSGEGTADTNPCSNPPDGPTKIARVPLNYPGAPDYRRLVNDINQAASATLAREAIANAALGVLGRYRLVGVQRPRTEQDKVVPWPPKLSNVIIEWDRQDSSCIGCHSRALSWRICEPGEADCQRCSTGCPTVKRDWVPQRNSGDTKLPQSDLFWGYAKASY